MRTFALLGIAAASFILAGCDDSDAPAPAPTATSTATLIPTSTATAPPTQTATPSATHTSSPTSTVISGPQITYFGLLRADSTVIEPSGTDAAGRPIFVRPHGSGFVLVVEARRTNNTERVGNQTFNHAEGSATQRPDLQILASRPLGDGSAAVCDNEEPSFGGIPAVDPPDFGEALAVADALNDFGCRFLDGAGDMSGRTRNEACALRLDGEYDFVDSRSETEFCALISAPFAFPTGDTLLTVRVRSVAGLLGPPAQIVVHVGVAG